MSSTAVDTADPNVLADEIDRALVSDGLEEEWVVSEVMDILRDQRDVQADPEEVLVAFGTLDSGAWWYRWKNEKLICTLKTAGDGDG